MPIVPKSRPGMLDFYESHIDAWRADPGAIGLDAGSADAQAARIDAARAAYDAHHEAINAARSATQRYHDAIAAMHADPGAGADMLETIKAFAQTTGDAGVYVQARIPPPADRSAAPPPGTPFDFRIGLRQDGAVELAWKCGNPRGTAGTVYEVLRAVGGDAQHGATAETFEFVATVGAKSFTDTTIPAGAARVVYQITALRSTRRGDPARHMVRFGVGEGEGSREGRGGMGLAA